MIYETIVSAQATTVSRVPRAARREILLRPPPVTALKANARIIGISARASKMRDGGGGGGAAHARFFFSPLSAADDTRM